MAQMAAAAAAMHFRPRHAMASILAVLDGAFDGIVEARPAGAAFEFLGRNEKTLSTASAHEGAGAFLMIEGAAAGRLGTMPTHDAILFRREKAPPFFIRTSNVKRLALHGPSLPWVRKQASHVQIGDAQRVVLDEFAARFDNIAHQFDEKILGLIAFPDLDLQQGPRVPVERRLPELIRVHFA